MKRRELLATVERHLQRLVNGLSNALHSLEEIKSRLERDPRQITVLVLGETLERTGRPVERRIQFAQSCSAVLERRDQWQAKIRPARLILAGAWVVVLGPAVIRFVAIGVDAQGAWGIGGAGKGGPIAKLDREVAPGEQILVELCGA